MDEAGGGADGGGGGADGGGAGVGNKDLVDGEVRGLYYGGGLGGAADKEGREGKVPQGTHIDETGGAQKLRFRNSQLFADRAG